ncbi:DNA mismatch repair protein [Boothiomyces macroporosus]|uniref:DNA mismatch repair protein n=1 Tax=Boothiomyces macroporosus TaxID=261099 RepID=A0AAD5ULK2_9FUNG|nr:DNA mismatch repair protein [Boothiomyces macroporosus]
MTQHKKPKRVQTVSTPVYKATSAPKPLSLNRCGSNFEWVNPVELPKQPLPRCKEGTLVSLNVEQFKKIKVIGQVDKKFIACQADGLILVVDQHAAHERIKLEEYLHCFVSDISPVQFEYSFEPYYQEQAKKHCKKLLRIGIHLNCTGFTIRKDFRTTELNVLAQIIKDSLDYYETVGLDLVPNPVVDHFKSKACRSAIMFGMKLSKAECEWIIQSLLKCKDPSTLTWPEFFEISSIYGAITELYESEFICGVDACV